MKKLIIILACAAMPASLSAEQWQILGTRPMGMGGAFVAVAQGPIAQYWNPAGLVKTTANVSGVEIPAGVNAEFTGGIIKSASEIGDMAEKFSAIQAAQQAGGSGRLNADQIAAFTKTVSLMSDMNKPGKGVLFEIAGGLNMKFSKVAVSINNFSSVGLSPFIDTVNIGLGQIAGAGGITLAGATATAPVDPTQAAAANTIAAAINTIGYASLEALICTTAGCLTGQNGGITDAATLANAFVNYSAGAGGLTTAQITEAANLMAQYAGEAAPVIRGINSTNPYSNNTSNLTVAGASFMEVAAGYAWNKDNWFDGLSVGGNVKMINGRTTVTTFRFLSEGDTGDALSMDNMKSSWKPALDLGVLWNVRSKFPGIPLSPKVGLVIRNINSPSFETNGAGDYDLKRQARLGFALNPTRFWTLAMDIDLTKNKTPVRGFESRQLAMGTEINVFNRKAFNIPLRAGLVKNLAESDSKMAFTLGSCLNLLHLHIDVSAVVSTETTELDGTELPTKVGASASLGLLF